VSTQSGLFAIIGKEFRRFFTDRRIVFTTVLLPGLMIYLIYSVMGNALQDMMVIDEEYQPVLYAVNLPDSLAGAFSSIGIDFEQVEPGRIDAIRADITDKKADLLIVFPADFDERVGRQLSGEQGVDPPRIEIFFNSTRTESAYQYQVMRVLLDQYKTALAPLFAVNAGSDSSMDTGGAGAGSSSGAGEEVDDPASGELPSYDLATQEDAAGFMFASLLPMFIMVFLFSGCMSVAPESIAGEKERGTIATMLVTPLARWELALGKIISLACIALLSGLSSFLGVMLSLPKLIGDATDELVGPVLYVLSDYLLILAVILSTVLLFVGVISLLSAVARTIKEATTYITPLMLVVLMISAMGVFAQGAAENYLFYLIPAYNSVQSMVGVFSFSYNPACILITVGANLAYTGICVAVLTWMFGNEKVVFTK